MCGAVKPVPQSIQEEVKVVKVVVVVEEEEQQQQGEEDEDEEEEEDKSAEKTASEVAAEGEGARCRGVPQSVGVRLASC